MTNSEKIKSKLGEYTEQLEQQLEPWQRGLILIALTVFLIFATYYLTKKETPLPRELTEDEKKKIEAMVEQRILRRAEFLRRLQG
jgi:DNA-binding transcriptional regulator YbjK